MLGDYYPLTDYSQAGDVWMAWQFDRSDLGGGMVQAFRRSQCQYESMMLKLYGLDPSETYRLFNIDTKETFDMSGRELMEQGFLCAIGTTSGSAVITYEVVPEPRSVTLAALGVLGFLRCFRNKQKHQ